MVRRAFTVFITLFLSILHEDDSDLEVELDPLPSVSSSVAKSIASYVKSHLQQQELKDARLEKSVAERAAAHHSSAKLQQSAATQGESAAAPTGATTPLTCSTSTQVPYSGSLNNQADRKRRRLWTPKEDLALIADVDKCGEGNWSTVLKNHYNFDGTASQLSLRSVRKATRATMTGRENLYIMRKFACSMWALSLQFCRFLLADQIIFISTTIGSIRC